MAQQASENGGINGAQNGGNISIKNWHAHGDKSEISKAARQRHGEKRIMASAK
jgi:hypothetical protein